MQVVVGVEYVDPLVGIPWPSLGAREVHCFCVSVIEGNDADVVAAVLVP